MADGPWIDSQGKWRRPTSRRFAPDVADAVPVPDVAILSGTPRSTPLGPPAAPIDPVGAGGPPERPRASAAGPAVTLGVLLSEDDPRLAVRVAERGSREMLRVAKLRASSPFPISYPNEWTFRGGYLRLLSFRVPDAHSVVVASIGRTSAPDLVLDEMALEGRSRLLIADAKIHESLKAVQSDASGKRLAAMEGYKTAIERASDDIWQAAYVQRHQTNEFSQVRERLANGMRAMENGEVKWLLDPVDLGHLLAEYRPTLVRRGLVNPVEHPSDAIYELLVLQAVFLNPGVELLRDRKVTGVGSQHNAERMRNRARGIAAAEHHRLGGLVDAAVTALGNDPALEVYLRGLDERATVHSPAVASVPRTPHVPRAVAQPQPRQIPMVVASFDVIDRTAHLGPIAVNPLDAAGRPLEQLQVRSEGRAWLSCLTASGALVVHRSRAELGLDPQATGVSVARRGGGDSDFAARVPVAGGYFAHVDPRVAEAQIAAVRNPEAVVSTVREMLQPAHEAIAAAALQSGGTAALLATLRNTYRALDPVVYRRDLPFPETLRDVEFLVGPTLKEQRLMGVPQLGGEGGASEFTEQILLQAALCHHFANDSRPRSGWAAALSRFENPTAEKLAALGSDSPETWGRRRDASLQLFVELRLSQQGYALDMQTPAHVAQHANAKAAQTTLS